VRHPEPSERGPTLLRLSPNRYRRRIRTGSDFTWNVIIRPSMLSPPTSRGVERVRAFETVRHTIALEGRRQSYRRLIRQARYLCHDHLKTVIAIAWNR
jgi:hypothetical protein